ncbi:MAG: DUF4007 family protein [Candidatus Riflebacteria bacterium]|nr:DUF4007 family protein [Candidatus Riflebacteria bacterium]
MKKQEATETKQKPIFSGHETFVCRYPWLPKAFDGVSKNPNLFSDEDEAMINLGVGKNMVRSIRFWANSMGIIESQNRAGYKVTPFGESIFAPNGYDPYLEDEKTLWLLHWKLCFKIEEPLFAWDFLINRWQKPNFSSSEILETAIRLPELSHLKLSRTTIDDHLGVFFRTYFPSRGKKEEVKEENLDSPFVELNFIEKTGERLNPSTGHFEAVYSFRKEEKSEISDALFTYALNDFISMRFPNDITVSFKDISTGIGSPGQIFKLSERDIRERLEHINNNKESPFEFHDSSIIQQIQKKKKIPEEQILKEVYQP